MVNNIIKGLGSAGVGLYLMLSGQNNALADASGEAFLRAFGQKPQANLEQTIKKAPTSTTNIGQNMTILPNPGKDGYILIPFNVKQGTSALDAYNSNQLVAQTIDKNNGNKDGKLSEFEARDFANSPNPFINNRNNYPVAGENDLRYDPATGKIGVIPGVQISSGKKTICPSRTEGKKSPQVLIESDKQALEQKIAQAIEDVKNETVQPPQSDTQPPQEEKPTIPSANYLYLPLDFTGGIARIDKENSYTADSAGIHQNNVLFNKPIQMNTDAMLLGFITTGLYRPHLDGQIDLINAYMKATHDAKANGLDNNDVGISALRFNHLKQLVGQKVGYNGLESTLTPDLIQESLRHHAIAESVARVFYENQNLENGYIVDVSNLIKRDRLRAVLSDNALLRPILPLNQILQGRITGFDYTEHDLTDNGIQTAQGIVNVQIDNTLSDFENRIYQAVKNSLGGELK